MSRLSARRTGLGLRDLLSRLDTNVRAIEAQRVVMFGHLGLGDQISLAPTLEFWATRIPHLIMPVKAKNKPILDKAYSYIGNLELVLVDIDDQRPEHAYVRQIATDFNATILDSGRDMYEWAKKAFPEFGINRCLSAAALNLRGEMTTSSMRKTFLWNAGEFETSQTKYAFIDHHEGTDREIPYVHLRKIQSRGLELVFNNMELPFQEMVNKMSNADELHLVSSAPLCVALACDLGGTRYRYRVNDEHPLKLDYPASWNEYRLSKDGTSLVDRHLEYEVSRIPWFDSTSKMARKAFLRSVSQVGGYSGISF